MKKEHEDEVKMLNDKLLSVSEVGQKEGADPEMVESMKN